MEPKPETVAPRKPGVDPQPSSMGYGTAVPPFTGAIIFCPLCCSTIDADRWGPQSHECVSCGTQFTINLISTIVAQHAAVG